MSPYLTIEEAAEYARTPIGTIRQWQREQRFKTTRPGKRVLIDRADFVAFLEASSRPAVQR